MIYREGLLAPRPTPKLEDHPLSAVHDCSFYLFAANFHKGSHPSISNLRTRHGVVTGTHYTDLKYLTWQYNIGSYKSHCFQYKKIHTEITRLNCNKTLPMCITWHIILAFFIFSVILAQKRTYKLPGKTLNKNYLTILSVSYEFTVLLAQLTHTEKQFKKIFLTSMTFHNTLFLSYSQWSSQKKHMPNIPGQWLNKIFLTCMTWHVRCWLKDSQFFSQNKHILTLGGQEFNETFLTYITWQY